MSLGSFRNYLNKLFAYKSYILLSYICINMILAQSAGAAEYTNCISTEG